MFPSIRLPWFSHHQCPSPRLVRIWLILAAAGITHTLWAVSYWLADIDLTIGDGATISALNVLAATLLAGGIAWIVAALLERFVAKARTAWTMGSCLSLGGSLIGPLSEATTTGATIVLLAMHIAVAAILIFGFRRTLRDRR